MAADFRADLPPAPPSAVAALRHNWGWFLALGIIQLIGGFVALTFTVMATEVTVVLIGCLALVGAVAELASIFWVRRWGEGALHVLIALLYAAFGVVVLANPGLAMVTLTLVLAVMLFVGGVFRIGVAAAARFHGWGWAVLSGVVSILLGAMVWAGWPESSLWVIGLFVGIDLIFMGAKWVAVAMAVRSIPPAGVEYRRDVPPMPAG
jgi:uncharacterized membrane protein HdeD (DUF308 family)